MTALPPSAPASRPRTGRGPTLLVVSGVVALAATVAAAVVTVLLLTRLLPTDLLDADGEPGAAVLGHVEVPGTVTLSLEAGTDYALYLASSRGKTVPAAGIEVVGPLGGTVDVAADAEVSVTTSRGGVTATTVGGFTTEQAGTYAVTAPSTVDGEPARLMVAPDQPVLPFVLTVTSSVLGVFVVLGLGATGLGLLVGGLVWRSSRRRAAV